MTSRTLMLLTLAASVQLFASAPAETIPAPVKERREHYVLRDADGYAHYEITERVVGPWRPQRVPISI